MVVFLTLFQKKKRFTLLHKDVMSFEPPVVPDLVTVLVQGPTYIFLHGMNTYMQVVDSLIV